MLDCHWNYDGIWFAFHNSRYMECRQIFGRIAQSRRPRGCCTDFSGMSEYVAQLEREKRQIRFIHLPTTFVQIVYMVAVLFSNIGTFIGFRRAVILFCGGNDASMYMMWYDGFFFLSSRGDC
jgi:hypothetical protein